MADGRVGLHSSQHQSSVLLTPSNAIKQLECPTDHKIFQAIRRQLNGSDHHHQRHHHHHHQSHHPEQGEWIREFLALGGWDYLLDALKYHSHNSGKNGECLSIRAIQPAPAPASSGVMRHNFRLKWPQLSNQSRRVDEQHSRTIAKSGTALFLLLFFNERMEENKWNFCAYTIRGLEANHDVTSKINTTVVLLVLRRQSTILWALSCCQNI